MECYNCHKFEILPKIAGKPKRNLSEGFKHLLQKQKKKKKKKKKNQRKRKLRLTKLKNLEEITI